MFRVNRVMSMLSMSIFQYFSRMSHNKTIRGSSLICSRHEGEGFDLWLWRFCVQIPIKVGRLDKQIKWSKKKYRNLWISMCSIKAHQIV